MPIQLAIVGIGGPLGYAIASQCDGDRDVETVTGIDQEPPRPIPEKTKFFQRSPSSDLAPLFKERRINAAIYLAPFPSGRVPEEPADEPLAGFLAAAGASGVKSVLVASGPFGYAAPPDLEPLGEGAPLLQGGPKLAEHDLARERLVAKFVEKNPTVCTTLCRLAPVVGPGTLGLAAQLLEAPRIPAIGDGKSRLQFLHVEDAGIAAFKLLKARLAGAYNLAPDDTISLAEMSRSLKRPLAPVSPLKARLLLSAAGMLGLKGLGGIAHATAPLLQATISLGNKKLKRDLAYRFKYACDGAIADHTRRRGRFG